MGVLARGRARALSGLAVGALLAGALAGPGGARATARSAVPTSVTVPMIADPGTINPILASDSYGRAIVSMLYPSLAARAPGGRTVPALARTWTVAENGLHIQVDLRPGLRWTDGSAVTADDVVTTFAAMADRRDHSPYFAVFRAMRAATVVGARTVAIDLSRPDPAFLRSVLFVPIAPASVLDPLIGRGKALARSPELDVEAHVTAGPFRLDAWDRSTGTLRFSRNRAYPWGAARLATFTLQYEPTADAAWQAFVDGRVAIANVPADAAAQAGALAKAGKLRLLRVPTDQYAYIAFNMTDPIWSDGRVREAAVEAVDRRAIAAQLPVSLGAPTGGPPPLSEVASGHRLAGLGYNLTRARALLTAAGWRLGAGGIRYKDGRPLAFTLLTVAGVPLWDRYVGIVAYDLRLAGFGVTVQYMTFSLLSQALAAPPGRASPGAWALAWEMTATSDARTLFGGPAAFPPAGQDVGAYDDPAVTTAMQTLAAGRAGAAARRRARARLRTALHADPPAIFLYRATGLVATAPALRVPLPPAAIGESLAWPQDWYYATP